MFSNIFIKSFKITVCFKAMFVLTNYNMFHTGSKKYVNLGIKYKSKLLSPNVGPTKMLTVVILKRIPWCCWFSYSCYLYLIRFSLGSTWNAKKILSKVHLVWWFKKSVHNRPKTGVGDFQIDWLTSHFDLRLQQPYVSNINKIFWYVRCDADRVNTTISRPIYHIQIYWLGLVA